MTKAKDKDVWIAEDEELAVMDKPEAIVEEAPKPLTDEEIAAKAKADREEAQKKFKIIDNARFSMTENQSLYQLDKLDVGQGLYIPLEPSEDIDKLVVAVHKQVNDYRIANSEVERNEEGDEILENYTIKARLRNPDGSFKLDGEGVPKLSVSSGLRPKLIGPRFAIRAVHKDDEMSENVKFDADGVLVIRLD